MAPIRNLIQRAASFHRKKSHRQLDCQDHSERQDDDENDHSHSSSQLDKPEKRLSGDTSATEVSSSSFDEPGAFDSYGLPGNAPLHRKGTRKIRVSASQLKNKESLGTFLKSEGLSVSSQHIRVRRKATRKGDAETRSVVSLPVRNTPVRCKSFHDKTKKDARLEPASPTRSSPTRSSSSRRIKVRAQDLSKVQSPVKSLEPTTCPRSAPGRRSQKIALRNLPRSPLDTNTLYVKSKSTRDLIADYNNILEEFDDSARGPRSNTADLLEEYSSILTEFEDSARRDPRTPFTTGWE